MKIKMGRRINGLSARSTCLTLLALVLAATFTIPAFAIQFDSGDLTGSFDTTLSYGLSWRMADQDEAIIGIDNGGTAYSLNGDDGNLNYDKGELFSNAAKITSDLSLQYNNFGLFVRGTAFYDFENNDGARERTELSDEALDMVGKDIELLDAYLTWDFNVGSMPAQIRVGNQVISWGESTFIQNSINAINPIDVSKYRVPGAELKEALIPVGIVSASISPTDNISFEGFYQYDWQETKIDPPGSYWSSNDFAGEGGDRVMLGFGAWPDQGTEWGVVPSEIVPWEVLNAAYGLPLPSSGDSRFNMVPRGPSIQASDDGQYGLAMRVYAPGLNDTEFGFYYMNYHSRLPVISARTGTAVGALKAAVAGAAATELGESEDLLAAVAAGEDYLAVEVAPGVFLPANHPAVLGDAATQIAVDAINATMMGAATPYGSTAMAKAFATNQYAQTAQYLVEYPEDIQLFGVSFNTLLTGTGIALQGEYSYRKDMPLQVDDLELLFAALGPISPDALAPLNQLANAYDPAQFDSPFEQYLQGYKRMDVSQIQATATKVFGPTFGADQFVLLGEAGLTHVHNMPSKDELRFNGPGTYISGNAALSAAHAPTAAGEYEPASAFADATSWGYRMIAKLDYNNAIGAVTLSPRIAWKHDVNGNSPGPGGNFLEGRKAVTLGLGANYQNKWTADLSYTDFFGAGRYNLVNDRDFVALNIKYSF